MGEAQQVNEAFGIPADIEVKFREPEKTSKPDLDPHGFPKKYFRITVYEGQGKHALAYVTPQVNGYAWKIQRGKEVIVPSVVVEALEHAVAEQTIQTKDKGLIMRPYKRFPFQIHGEATEAEYKEFQKKMREEGRAAQQVAA